MRPARIAGENDGEALLVRLRGREPMPRANAVHHGIDALAVGLMRQMRELQITVALARRLEADDAGGQPPVNLGQLHMHR